MSHRNKSDGLWIVSIAGSVVCGIAALWVLKRWPNSVLGLSLTALAFLFFIVAFENT